MGLLQDDERQDLIDRLLRLPNIRETGVRRSLVAGLPEALRNGVASSDVAQIEVMSIIEIVDGETWGQLANDSWSVIKVIENAVALVRGSKLGAELEKLLNTLKSRAVELKAPQADASSATPVVGRLLNGEQTRKLHAAFLSAFTIQELEMMLLFQLDLRLENIVPHDNFRAMVFELIEWAEQRGMVSELINGALAANPGNGALRTFAEEMGLVATSPATPAPAPAQPQPETPRGETTTPVFIDVESWRARMSEAEPTVCRVELSGEGTGTGFLVGPSVAMTSYHVVSRFIGKPQEITLRFGYKMSPDGTTLYQGQVYQLADDWLMDSDEALDFALLRVLGSPGDEPGGNQPGAPPRRWLNPKVNHTFKEGEPMYMIQHPLAGPLKIAFEPESVVGVDPDHARLSYRINSAPGSAGAPCFTAQWELVALHHSKRDGIAMGTPMSAIVSRPKVKAALGT